MPTLKAWQDDYNHQRPHSSLGHLTPSEFAMKGQETASETAKLYLRCVEKPDQPYVPESSTSRPSTFRGSLRDESRNRRVKTIAHVLPFPGVGGTEHATLRIAAVIDPSKFKSIAFCLPHAPAVRALFEDHGIASAIYEPAVRSYLHSFTFMR